MHAVPFIISAITNQYFPGPWICIISVRVWKTHRGYGVHLEAIVSCLHFYTWQNRLDSLVIHRWRACGFRNKKPHTLFLCSSINWEQGHLSSSVRWLGNVLFLITLFIPTFKLRAPTLTFIVRSDDSVFIWAVITANKGRCCMSKVYHQNDIKCLMVSDVGMLKCWWLIDD